MSIWTYPPTVEDIHAHSQASLVAHLGIEFLEIGDDFMRARMPVDERTVQPAGILHGGASVVLAETLGSVAANYCVDRESKMCVGLEVNANHVRSAKSGYVYGVARPAHLGGTTQLWDIRITDDNDRLVCVSRLTMAVLNR
ncbi:esterase [Alkalilimnicola ehrlichii]|uniref:Esterase n=1 Tax=Alkalilimnicola ehrlichii TaxID=351052 RepID=A0A3E0X024_9GAMM|nr:hotdog fold thioesterase [Alkalilimnicola ehrlichii]RFA29041.1 esterase [Alkalilimnicola ehrlichii]RFA38679.1 esterase [Alkalilimnicola ehrlichii]